MPKKTARASPSSPKRARAMGKPIKPLLLKAQAKVHSPRRSLVTRNGRASRALITPYRM